MGTELHLAFQSIAAKVGVALPSPLANLLASGKTTYGPAWQSTWRMRCLVDPPALISCFDFEWIDAGRSRETIVEWLNPEFQAGRSFLPFAKSGAGDSYCLTLTEANEVGVAYIWHDNDESCMLHRNFSDFVCAQFLDTLADLSHLLEDDGFTEEEAVQVVRTDIFQVAGCMEPSARDYLLAFRDLEPSYRMPVNSAQRRSSKGVFSLISEEQLAAEMLKFPPPDGPPFVITARWECRRRNDTQTIPETITWERLALDPAKKMQAIRAYQAEKAVSLSVAKLAVDQYVADSQGDI